MWFGAAAPLALLSPLARDAGATRVIASTHGHEVGWSMLPLARTALRRIGNGTDVVTYVSQYTRGRFASAFGRDAALERLSPGVDIDRFAPDAVARAELRARYRLGDRPVVVCVSRLVPRKGQDMLIRALPAIRQRVPGRALVIVGGGPYRDDLHRLAHSFGVAERRGVHRRRARRRTARPPRDGRRLRDAVPHPRLRASTSRASASSTWRRRRPACRSWRAGPAGHRKPCVDGETGLVVDGWDVGAIAAAVGELLADPDRAARMGAAGRRWVVDNWQWRTKAAATVANC